MSNALSTAALLALVCAGSAASVSEPTTIDDREQLPPAIETVKSRNGDFALELTAGSLDSTAPAVAALYVIEADGSRTQVWRTTLPHRMRPRVALVANDGSTLLFDEWWRTPSRYSVIVINPDNSRLVEHDFDSVAAVLGVTRADLVRKGRLGPWMSSHPQLSDDETRAEVEAADKTLIIDIATGHLSVRTP